MAAEIVTLKEALTAFSAQQTRGGRVATMAAATDADTPDAPSLYDLMHKDNTAPSSTSVAAVPTNITPEMQQQLEDVMMLTSFISASSMRYIYQTTYKGRIPDITSPQAAAEFVKAAANAKNFVLTKALGGYLSLNTSSARSFHQNTTSADLHLSFLSTLFDGFGFPASTMKELDGVLGSVNQTLSDLKLSWSDQSSTLDHMIFFYYFDALQGLDVKIPKIRLYFLHIDQASWTASLGKSSVTHFDFNMNFIDSIYDMDTAQTAADRDTIKSLLKQWSGHDLDALNQLLSPKAVNDAR